MSGLFKNFGFASSTASEGVRLTAVNSAPLDARGHDSAVRSTVVVFPKRPDITVLSQAIPLFYIARNKHGFWVAREAEGHGGGTFLLRRSAIRFARHRSAPAGCAMMFLNDELELGIEDEGGRLVETITALIDVVNRRAPKLADFLAMVVTEWRKLVGQISRAFAGERRNRATIERELFCGQYMLSSKNDDDLPIP